MTGLYVYPVSFDVALLTLTVFTTLHNSMSESHSVATVKRVSQKSNVKIVTNVKRKTWSKGKANFKNIAEVLANNSKNFH